MTRIRPGAAVAAAGLMALSACAQAVEATPSSAGKAAAVRLAVTEVGPLGDVVTDQHGRTLYRYDRDGSSPPASNCDGDCAKDWPPVVVANPDQLRLDGVDERLVATVRRADGTLQLTLNGWPLYRSARDGKPGEFNGQGYEGTWFASTPHGNKAEATQAAPPAEGGSGY